MNKPSFHKPLLNIDLMTVELTDKVVSTLNQVKQINSPHIRELENILQDCAIDLHSIQLMIVTARRLEKIFRTGT